MVQTQSSNSGADIISGELYNRIKQNDLDIPLLPDVANRVVQITQDEDSTAQTLASLIQSDQALAAHIIRVANSATYSPNSTIVSLQQAVARLGMRTLSEIALATSMNASLFSAPGFEDEIELALKRSLSAGLFAKEVARACRKNVEAAFLGGLLCDIGRPMVLHTASEISHLHAAPLNKDAMQTLMNKFSRAMSSRVVKKWNMPSPVQQVIINFGQYQNEHAHQNQTHIAVAGMALARFFERTFESYDDIKAHPVFGDLNLYEDELEKIFVQHEAINATVEAMRK